jgi:hypothetical protein
VIHFLIDHPEADVLGVIVVFLLYLVFTQRMD